MTGKSKAFILARWCIVAFAVTSLPAATPLTREQALEDIGKSSVQARRQAVARLSEIGTMGDSSALLRTLRDEDEEIRALSEHALWQVWSRSEDPRVDKLFRQGVEQMSRGMNQAAIATFTRVIKQKPGFAEGWNKRATAYFIVGDYRKSLKDCDEVIKRNPNHFGALAGYGQIYMRLEQPERALQYFQRALAVNPNMEGVAALVVELQRVLEEKRDRSI